jgi:hypothetical protein
MARPQVCEMCQLPADVKGDGHSISINCPRCGRFQLGSRFAGYFAGTSVSERDRARPGGTDGGRAASGGRHGPPR